MLHWPAEHPACTDPALAQWRPGADELCPDGSTVVEVLRHLPGRRVATLIRTRERLIVLKLFASPRGRGNHRRLCTLASTTAAPRLPTPIAASRDGHSTTLTFQPGTPMPQLPDDDFVAGSADAGDALRQLHASGAILDRAWTVHDELRQLAETAGTTTRQTIDRVIMSCRLGPSDQLVPSHRDYYAAQIVRCHDCTRLIDLDDAAMAPPALDVANFVAHLDKDQVDGSRRASIVAAARRAFLDAYGRQPDDLRSWHRLSLARLVALAETRHHDPGAVHRLTDLLEHT